MTRATIAGTGFYAPPNVIENDFFDKKYNRDISKFLREQRNIQQRHWMSPDQSTSDLIIPAAEEAMRNAGITAKDVDLIIVATDTPEYISPATAAVVQHRLGAMNAGTFDLNTACAGFVMALDVASKYIAADPRYRNILVVGAYAMTKYFDWEDYKVTSIFADGAGAVIVQPTTAATEGLGVLTSELYSEGQYHDYMGVYAGGTKYPISEENLSKKLHQLVFAKRIPPEANSIHWPRLTKLVLDRIQKQVKDVDRFFFTQININSITETLDTLGAPHEKSHNIMDRFGYTGSACIPMAIADAARQHKLKKGDLVMLVGSGGGMSMAAMALRWSYDT
jgi:3-oxoacyl-[acyl-carrier-protein] synthase-3